MKVVFHIPFPAVGGAELQIKYLIENFSSDIQPIITYEYLEAEAFVKSLRVPSYRVHSPITLFKTLESIQPDVVQFFHSHTMYNALKRMTRRPKTVEIIHNRAGFPGDGASYPKNFTDMVVCVSPDAQSYFLSKMPNIPTVVIPNGVDSRFKPATLRSKRMRPLGGFTGRLEPGDGKGVQPLIEILKDMPELDFEFVGVDMGGYAKQLVDRGIKHIKVLPHTSDPLPYYQRWDYFVSKSPNEGFGLSIAEALACGLSSAIYDCGGVCAYIENGRHALLANNDTELKAAIKKTAFGKVKLDPTSLDLGAKRMASSYEELYCELRGKVQPAVAQSATVIPIGAPVKSNAILSTCPKDWLGVKRALMGCSDKWVSTDDAMREIIRTRPAVLVFGCYQMQQEPILIHAKRLGIKTVLTWHASYVLNEFDHVNREWMWHALACYKKGLFDYVATPHAGLAETWSHYGIPTDYLPNILADSLFDVQTKKKDGINIGLLGSGMPWKNMDCQAIAAGMIEGATIHTQGLRHMQSLDSLGVKVKVHPKTLTDSQYYDLLGGMDVNLCVSMSEVYSYLTAESLALGVPVITSSINPIMMKSGTILENCLTPYFEDPRAIMEVIVGVLLKREKIAAVGRKHMLDFNKQAKAQVASVKEKWLCDKGRSST